MKILVLHLVVYDLVSVLRCPKINPGSREYTGSHFSSVVVSLPTLMPTMYTYTLYVESPKYSRSLQYRIFVRWDQKLKRPHEIYMVVSNQA